MSKRVCEKESSGRPGERENVGKDKRVRNNFHQEEMLKVEDEFG